jgi:hypothetical protein
MSYTKNVNNCNYITFVKSKMPKPTTHMQIIDFIKSGLKGMPHKVGQIELMCDFDFDRDLYAYMHGCGQSSTILFLLLSNYFVPHCLLLLFIGILKKKIIQLLNFIEV